MYLIAKKNKALYVLSHTKNEWVRLKCKRAKAFIFQTLDEANAHLKEMGIDENGSTLLSLTHYFMNTYTPFSERWKREMMRWTKDSLLNFGLSEEEKKALSSKCKKDIVEFLRVKFTIKNFNERFKVGDTVNWREIADYSEPTMPLILKAEAFNSHGRAVAFFKEKSSYCSIEGIHID